MNEDRLTDVLRSLLPRKMADAVAAENDPEFVARIVRLYLTADDATQADLAAFHECGADKVVGDLRVRDEAGTPTSKELSEWLAR